MDTPVIVTVPACLAESGINVTPQIVQKLGALADIGGILRFEQGEYHFYEDGALHSFFAPSNNTSGQKNVCFPLLDARGITVDGGGSVFVFHGNAFPFIVSESSDIVLKNFTCDTAYPSVAALELLEKTDEGFFCRIDRQKSPFRTENGHLVFERENGVISTEDGRLSIHSLDRMSIHYLFAGDTSQSKDALPAAFVDTDAFDLGDRIYFRYREGTQISYPYEIGERVVINLEEKRERSVFFLENSERVTLENITIRRGGGMGVIAQMCTDVTVKNMRTDKTAHGDAVTLTADAFHIIQCSGRFELTGCDMESFLDDACNVHGVYTVLDRCDKDCLHLHLGHSQHDHFSAFKAGDRIVFICPQTLERVAEAEVDNVFFTSNDGMNLTVKACFAYGADRLEPGFLVENPARMPDICIHHNRFRDFPHFRLSGAGKIRVEDNVISECHAAILFLDLAKYWYESGRIRDAKVRRNLFENCNALGSDTFITVGVSGFDAENAPTVHESVEITDNRFEGLRACAVQASGVKKLVLDGNTAAGKPLDGSFFRLASSVSVKTRQH